MEEGSRITHTAPQGSPLPAGVPRSGRAAVAAEALRPSAPQKSEAPSFRTGALRPSDRRAPAERPERTAPAPAAAAPSSRMQALRDGIAHACGHRLLPLLLLLIAFLAAVQPAAAQSRRGPRTIVRRGLIEQPDTLARGSGALALSADSLLFGAGKGLTVDSLGRIVTPAGIVAALDSANRLVYVADTLSLDSLGLRAAVLEPPAGTVAALDSANRLVYAADTLSLDSLGLRAAVLADTLGRDSLVYDTERILAADDSLRSAPSVLLDTTRRKRGWFMSDSMSLSKVCWISAVLPGYGQVYNKQYWKLPILYGTLGAGLALFIRESNDYRPMKRAYDQLTLISTDRDAALDVLQTKMIRSNTRRQLYLGVTIASYVYFLGDAAVNYATNDVSDVKKATTLACICPGAGQIYNKSYWKVPFVVGGFASMIYCIDWNNRGFQRFKKAYALRTAYDDNRDAYPDGSPDEFQGRIPAKTLKSYKDSYRRNRDLCIILTAGLYILQIVDAHVDAHLKDYDISDDLSMNLEPLIDYPYMPAQGGNRPVFGFNMSINF